MIDPRGVPPQPYIEPPGWALLMRLGEAEILLPLQVVLALWLWRAAATRGLALHWCLATWVAAAFITVGKVGFIGFNLGYAPWGLAAISGHALFAAAIWPVAAWVVLAPQWPAHRRAPVALGLLVAGVVAYGRVHTWAHSAVESVLGLGLGAACSLWPLARAGALARPANGPVAPPRPRTVPGWLVAGMALWLLVWATLGPPSRAQAWVTAVALKLSGRSQPFYPDRGYEAQRLQQQQQQRAYQRELQAQAAAQAASGAARAGGAGASGAGR